MKIILIAKTWGANSGIGSLRPMKITKYLLKLGHQVTIVCGNIENITTDNDPDLYNFRKNPLYNELSLFGNSGIYNYEDKLLKSIIEKRRNRNIKTTQNITSGDNNYSIKHSIKLAIVYLYNSIYSPIKMLNSANVSFKSLTGIEKPDVIISSYEPLSVTILGKKLKQKYPSSIWVSDFRDQIPRPHDPFVIKSIRRIIQKRLCKYADIVTIVSNTWKKNLQADGIKNVYMLSSGFDTEDYVPSTKLTTDLKYLKFTYIGNLYKGKSDITPVVHSIARLIKSNKIDSNKIKLIYAGNHSSEFLNQTSCLKNQITINNYGHLPRIEALNLEHNSDILIHAAWSTKKDTGIMTGKIYEYLLAKKPIISILQGDRVGSELSIMLQNANAGFIYEEAKKNQNHLMDKYIEDKYNEKFIHGKIEYKPDIKYISNFNYENIVNNLINIINAKRLS